MKPLPALVAWTLEELVSNVKAKCKYCVPKYVRLLGIGHIIESDREDKRDQASIKLR